MSTTIYVVYGERGDYDDHFEWVIAYYSNELNATKHLDALETWLIETINGSHRNEECPYNNCISMDGTEQFWVSKAELEDTFG